MSAALLFHSLYGYMYVYTYIGMYIRICICIYIYIYMSLLVCALHWCAFVWATLCCAPASPESAGYSHSGGGHFRECRARVGNSHHGCHLELQCNPCSYCRARQSIDNRDSSAVIFVFQLRQALSAESRPDLRLKACLLCSYACPAHGTQRHRARGSKLL